jgi:uncharacterized protein involved in cysteine biosynthesis
MIPPSGNYARAFCPNTHALALTSLRSFTETTLANVFANFFRGNFSEQVGELKQGPPQEVAGQAQPDSNLDREPSNMFI